MTNRIMNEVSGGMDFIEPSTMDWTRCDGNSRTKNRKKQEYQIRIVSTGPVRRNSHVNRLSFLLTDAKRSPSGSGPNIPPVPVILQALLTEGGHIFRMRKPGGVH